MDHGRGLPDRPPCMGEISIAPPSQALSANGLRTLHMEDCGRGNFLTGPDAQHFISRLQHLVLPAALWKNEYCTSPFRLRSFTIIATKTFLTTPPTLDDFPLRMLVSTKTSFKGLQCLDVRLDTEKLPSVTMAVLPNLNQLRVSITGSHCNP